MKTVPISPLAVKFPTMPELAGLRMATSETGLRYKGRPDLLMMEFAPDSNVAGVFTRNQFPGAPVTWCRQQLSQGQHARALIVNAGNANVFIGKIGEEITQLTAKVASHLFACRENEIFLASTGIIGQFMPIDAIARHLPFLYNKLGTQSWQDSARAIMTTDTFPKGAMRQIKINNQTITIAGIAKGSGMIAPDMATTLAFVVTDASIAAPILQKLLSQAVKPSFNCITVDSDTSTSDTLLLFATGQADYPKVTALTDPLLLDFTTALNDVVHDLAMMVIRDGEGAKKLIQITVNQAVCYNSAHAIAMSIAKSPLVKAAIAGEDANWGRIIMAIGKTGQPVNRDTVNLSIGGILVAKNGQAINYYNEKELADHMETDRINILVSLGLGHKSATVWTCDLTHAYLDINGSYRS